MMILASDYDGTLTHGGVTDEKCRVIRRWREAGNLFGIISGRNADFRQTILKKYPSLELDFFACFNGGSVLDSQGNVRYETRCETVDALQLTKDLLKWGCPFVRVNSPAYRCIVSSLENKPRDTNESDVCPVDDVRKLGPFHQISVQLSTTEQAKHTVDRIRFAYGEALNPLQNGRDIDIVPPGVNKARGLYRVMELFGAKHEDVIAVGDNVNDMDMLREFRSYAMQTAPDEVKRIATSVTSGVDDLILLELDHSRPTA